jgi:hypothetical protein
MSPTMQTIWMNYRLFRAQEHGWDDWRIEQAHQTGRDPLGGSIPPLYAE